MRRLVSVRSAIALSILVGLLAFVAGWYSTPAPATAQAPIRWKVQSAWPPTSIVQDAAKLLVETIEKTNMNSLDCYKVKHTWKSGRTTHDCFSVTDGLIVASVMKQTTQMGEIEVTQLLSAYKDFGGVKKASVTSLQMMGQEIRTTVVSWEWDTVKPEDMEPPADIKALLKKG